MSAFPDEFASFPDELASFPNELASFPNELASSLDERASFPDEPASFLDETIAFPDEITSFPDETIRFSDDSNLFVESTDVLVSWDEHCGFSTNSPSPRDVSTSWDVSLGHEVFAPSPSAVQEPSLVHSVLLKYVLLNSRGLSAGQVQAFFWESEKCLNLNAIVPGLFPYSDGNLFWQLLFSAFFRPSLFLLSQIALSICKRERKPPK